MDQAIKPQRSPFLLLMGGQLISNLGDALAGLAVTWLIVELTNSTMARGLSLALSVLPVLLLSPFSGALVDRHRRKSILATSDCVRFLIDLLFGLVVLAGWVRVWQIYLFMVLRSAATIFYDPALNALIQLLVPPERLVKANGLQQLARNAAMVVGPALASLSLAKLGIGMVIIVDGLTFLFSAVVITYLQVPIDAVSPGRHGAYLVQLRDGWNYVRQRTWIIYLTSSFVLVNASSAILGVILPFIARDVLQMDLVNFGWLNSASAAGAVSAALLLVSINLRWSRRRVLTVTMLVTATAMALMTLTRTPLAAMAVLFLAGLAGPFMASTSNAMYQAVIPREYMGRVGVFRAIVSRSMQPVFFLFTGLLSQRLGYTSCLLIAAALPLLAAAMVHCLVRVPETTAASARQSVAQ